MFVTDPTSHLTWFEPCSLEPLYMFELLGLLFSLAVYDGLTLPVNFPLTFYNRFLGGTADFQDGYFERDWPEIHGVFQKLLEWHTEDGDVDDVFAIPYALNFEILGENVSIDMSKVERNDSWPGPDGLDPTQETDPPYVTNETRSQFVSDYVFWLTDKSVRPQFEAFAKGFRTCVSQDTLAILTPTALRSIVEGHQQLNAKELAMVAHYEDGYSPDHPFIRQFWHLVCEEYTPSQQLQLLEFVTASDRLPANGLHTLKFVVQRVGGDSERIPSSMTCFGRLLLPQYSSYEKLKQKLGIALENAKGFGTM